MNRLFLSFAIVLSQFAIKAQVSLGIVGSLTVSPSFTVTNGTTIYVAANIKNTGTVTLNGTIGLKLNIDISTTTTPNYFFRAVAYFNVSGFAPNAIITQTVSDVAANYNQYKTDGNGVTVVVFPIFNGDATTTSDSVKTTVYVTLLNGIEDVENFEAKILKIRNPVTELTYLNYSEELYQKVELLNVMGKTIQIIEDKKLDASSLSKGLYYLNFWNSKTHQVVTKKIIVE